MRVEDRQLETLVLEEPGLGRHLELEAVRRGGCVAAADVALGDAVAEHDEPAGLVRRLGLRVGAQLRPDLGRDHHQTVRSIDSATSSASQKSADRYFQPPSARMQTTTPSSSSPASFRATCATAPDETPPKIPSATRSCRRPATASSFETRIFRSSFATSRIGGT